MRTAQQHHRTLTRRGGFTLVELLAALGITLLLIAAITSSLDVYLRLTTTGAQAVERQQVTRALLQQMTRDISSIVFTVPEEESEEDPAAEDEAVTIVVEDASSSIASTSVGLIGDSQMLVLNVSRPSPNLGYSSPSAAVSVSERTSDLMSVSYFLAGPGGSTLATAVGENAASYGTIAGPSDGTGLARLEGDRMAIDHADLQMETQLLADAASLIAPEIISVQFRYFDGSVWQDAWDSTAYGALPQAIEVTLGFREPEEETSLNSAPTVVESVRHVIHVPVSEPYSASSTF